MASPGVWPMGRLGRRLTKEGKWGQRFTPLHLFLKKCLWLGCVSCLWSSFLSRTPYCHCLVTPWTQQPQAWVRNSSTPIISSGLPIGLLQFTFAPPIPLQTLFHLFIVWTLALREEMSKGMNLEEDALEKRERKYRQITPWTLHTHYLLEVSNVNIWKCWSFVAKKPVQIPFIFNEQDKHLEVRGTRQTQG